jgi:uncharacterized protein GlcG (DUF336 family)
MGLILSDAVRLLEAAEARAREIGVKAGIAVVDARGDIIAMHRMDASLFFAGDVARGKAAAAATFGAPSGSLPQITGNPVLGGLGFVFRPGAVPVGREGAVEGAVGVAGGTSEEDEDIARAAAATLC